MPSKEEMCFIPSGIENSKTSNGILNREKNCVAGNAKDFLARDMEDLVLEIKENLRLKSRPAYANHTKACRPSPYRVPSRSRSWGEDDGHCTTTHSRITKNVQSVDDPYEMLQELLRDGSLIKEAVRRLELGLSPKQRYFYESDEDSRTPLRVCNLEL